MADWGQVIASAVDGSDAALGRAVTAVESNDWAAIAALGRRVMSSDRHAPRIGLTGAAGAGKSTLLAALGRSWPGGHRVGGIAVDPSSEISGGAVLGDRYRLYNGRGGDSQAERRLFLRSMAARGSAGALSRHVGLVAALLEEAGLSPLLIETAGAGQSDTGVKDYVDCLVLVLTPESGDIIQMLKAGLMEWADVFVVNKADREGSDRFAAQLRGLVTARRRMHGDDDIERVHLVRADQAGPEDLQPLIDVVARIAASKGQPRPTLWESVSRALLEHAAIQAFRKEVMATAEWETAVTQCSTGQMTADDLARQLVAAVSRV